MRKNTIKRCNKLNELLTDPQTGKFKEAKHRAQWEEYKIMDHIRDCKTCKIQYNIVDGNFERALHRFEKELIDMGIIPSRVKGTVEKRLENILKNVRKISCIDFTKA